MNAYVTRFSRRQRLEHVSVMTLFILLSVTGLPQKFYTSGWAEAIILGLGGIDRVRWIHRVAGVLFTLLTVVHMTVSIGLVVLGRSALSLVPTRQDFVDAITQLRYYLGVSEVQAKFDKFDYKQKFEYWGLVLGAVIVISTGLILLFPIETTWFLPGEVIPAAKLAHGNEGLMAFLVVIIWHIYNAHLNPDVFPFDTSIFTGKIALDRLRHEHSLEFDRLKETE
ncbi:MAG: cytochrome C [Acidobacteria bacterium]|nr:MAG: cytochrome C [Acidobacteriota bacterium]